MTQYLLSVYQPDGDPPPPAIMEQVMRDVGALAHLGGFTVIEAPDLDAALQWGRKAALATTLPIEVRPFQDGAGG